VNYARLSALKRIESLASGTYHRVSCRLQDIDHVLQLHVPRIYLHRSTRSRVSPHVETWLCYQCIFTEGYNVLGRSFRNGVWPLTGYSALATSCKQSVDIAK
jgi:hypothetical protein